MSSNKAMFRKLAYATNPRRFGQVAARSMKMQVPQGTLGRQPGSLDYNVSVGGYTSLGDSCCPTKGKGSGGLPYAPNAPIQFDKCRLAFWSNISTDYRRNPISYQRSRLIKTSWNANEGANSLLLTGAEKTAPVDGLIYVFPSTNGLASVQRIEVQEKGFTAGSSQTAAAGSEDFDEAYQLYVSMSQGPAIFGHTFCNGNGEQRVLRIQQAEVLTLTLSSGTGTLNYPAQGITVTINGWVSSSAIASVVVYPLNSSESYIKVYTDKLVALSA